ncbi:RTA1 like protein-domain-containing protein [Lasiosphaeria miniovina]|uniref:RTA1 like protein-domain-containing protein n=1 Tax=Lasiosphaeria miniovina TaxID=1954250 RepID=A0AA40B3T1_9PEZI|nr:RTA1 like protein-domain-containing protein [Lasiosphaeria miniovina]KAK0727153.1 RTA1 like protein-domain-containing protein [Lasiosphaeria miniovina]
MSTSGNSSDPFDLSGYNGTGPIPPAPPGVDPDLWQGLFHIRTGCFPFLVDGIDNSYSYWPTLGAGIAFDVLFGIALIGHLIQFARFRKWTSILFALGAATEAIGWAGRTWSAKCPYNRDAFLMQITTLIIAPTFFAAALYVLLHNLITRLGRETSMLSPRMYAIVFCTCDVISLVVQAVGGAMASQAADSIDGNTAPGTNTMVAGIAFQLFTMSIFAVFVVDFLRRVQRISRRGPGEKRALLTRPIRLVLVAVFISFIMIYVRSIYRTIELAQGWTGNLITHEGYFIGLDATLMFIAVAVFLVFDPASLLRDDAVGRPATALMGDPAAKESDSADSAAR